MLYKSGHNLKEGALQFMNEKDEITIFSAYLKLNELKELNTDNKVKRIVVRWELEDLHESKKVSDIEVYQYCLDNQIALYRNTRIHLKTFWNGKKSVFFGSANITGRGIGEKGDFNYELNEEYSHNLNDYNILDNYNNCYLLEKK